MATPFGPELQFPPDDFASVTPAELAAARAELDDPGEIQFPEATFEDVTPEALQAARAEMRVEDGTLGYAGGDPFEVLRAPSAERPYMGLPTNPDLAPPVEPEPLPTEDAITGVGPIPASPMAGGLGIPEAMFQAAMRGVPMETQGTPELPAEYLSNEENGIAYAMSSPEQQINQQLDLETRRAEFQRQADAELRTADALRAERSEQNFYKSRETSRKKLEQVAVEAEAEAAREIDINRGWADASTGTKIAGIFSALAGGLVAHKYGGRNSGLEMIDKLIDRDIDAQKFNKQQRVNALTAKAGAARDQIAMAEDDYVSDTRMRLAAYNRVAAQILADAQNFDPRGTQAIRYGQAYQDLIAKSAQVAQDAKKRGDAIELARLEFDGKKLDNDIKRAKFAKDQRAAMGEGGPGKAKQSPGEWAALYGDEGRPPRAMDAKEYKEWVATGGKVATIAKTKAEAAKALRDERRAADDAIRELGMGGSTRVALDDAGQPVIDGSTGKPAMVRGNLLNKDGAPWKARNPEVADKLATNYASAEDTVAMLDEILDIRDRVGGESTTFNSDDAQRLQVLEAQVLKRVKEGTHGMSSDADMNVLKAAVGAKDIASFRAKAAGLEKGRERVIATLNRDLRYRGAYTGDPVTFANPYGKAPAATAEEEKRKALFKAPEISIDEADRQAAVIVRKQYGDDFKDPSNVAAVSRDISAMAADYKDISPDQKLAIRKLGDLAGGSGASADRAEKDLRDIAANGHNEKIRASAQEALMSAARTKGGV